MSGRLKTEFSDYEGTKQLDGNLPKAGSCAQRIPKLDPSYREISNLSFSIRVIAWLIMLLGGLSASINDITWVSTIGIVILGLAIAHGVELSHQALHDTGFTSQKLNEFCGVLMGLPLLVSFYEYKLSHLQHHAKLGTKEDTEYFDFADGDMSFASIIATLTMWRHYARYVNTLVRVVLGGSVPGFKKRHQHKLKLFYAYSIFMVSLFVCVGFLIGEPAAILISWMSAMFFVATPVHALIEFPEHFGCNRASKNVFHSTRSIRSNALLSWFTNYNNYHVEHHAYPMVPLQKTPEVFNNLKPEHQHYARGYLEFYTSVVLRRGG